MKNNATILRIIMTVLVVVLFGSSCVGFYYIQQYLAKYSSTINTSTANDYSNVTAAEIQSLQQKLTSLQNTIGKASDIIIGRDNYQNQAIQDINKYAADSGVSISGGFSFTRPTTAKNSLRLFSGSSDTDPVVFNIENPVEYSRYLKFIRLIETNIPLMQLSGINLSRSESTKTAITSDPISIEVYTK